MPDYLPKHATAVEACEWLQVQTGKSWTLARLLENGLTPWFWLDYKPGYPAIFGHRVEGYLAPMVFAGDTQRLEADGTDSLVNLTRAHDGVLMKVEPGMKVPTKELKFKREDVQALSKAWQEPAPAIDNAPPAPVVAASDGPETLPAVPNWKMLIQTEATAHCLRLRKAGANPTRNSILDSMAQWCRDNRVITDGGIYPSANYLRTWVLGGKYWEVPR